MDGMDAGEGGGGECGMRIAERGMRIAERGMRVRGGAENAEGEGRGGRRGLWPTNGTEGNEWKNPRREVEGGGAEVLGRRIRGLGGLGRGVVVTTREGSSGGMVTRCPLVAAHSGPSRRKFGWSSRCG